MNVRLNVTENRRANKWEAILKTKCSVVNKEKLPLKLQIFQILKEIEKESKLRFFNIQKQAT